MKVLKSQKQLKILRRNKLGQRPQKTSKQPWRTEKICRFNSTRTIRECRGFKEKHQCYWKRNLCSIYGSCIKNCKNSQLLCWRTIQTAVNLWLSIVVEECQICVYGALKQAFLRSCVTLCQTCNGLKLLFYKGLMIFQLFPLNSRHEKNPSSD